MRQNTKQVLDKNLATIEDEFGVELATYLRSILSANARHLPPSIDLAIGLFDCLTDVAAAFQDLKKVIQGLELQLAKQNETIRFADKAVAGHEIAEKSLTREVERLQISHDGALPNDGRTEGDSPVTH